MASDLEIEDQEGSVGFPGKKNRVWLLLLGLQQLGGGGLPAVVIAYPLRASKSASLRFFSLQKWQAGGFSTVHADSPDRLGKYRKVPL